MYAHLVQASSRAGLNEDAMDDGVLHHGEVGASLLLCQGEEGGGEEEEGEQVQPHLWPRGNEQTITRENSVV